VFYDLIIIDKKLFGGAKEWINKDIVDLSGSA